MKGVRLCVVVLMLLGIGVGCGEDTSDDSNEQGFLSVIREPVVLVDETVKVENLSYHYWSMDLDLGDLLTINIVSDRDISVYLLREREFQSFERRETFSTEVDRSDVYRVTLEYTVTQSDTYYLVLNNRYSILTDKDVTVHVTVQ